MYFQKVVYKISSSNANDLYLHYFFYYYKITKYLFCLQVECQKTQEYRPSSYSSSVAR